jgi:hypothetical protein
MVQQNSTSESTKINSQENKDALKVDVGTLNDSSAANSKKGIKVLRAEIQAHFHQIQEYLNENDAEYTKNAFHEADTLSHKIRDLCDMDEKLTNSHKTCPLCFEQIDDKTKHGSWCK